MEKPIAPSYSPIHLFKRCLLNAFYELNVLEILTSMTWSLYTQGGYSLRRDERQEKEPVIGQRGVMDVKGTRRGR